MSKDRKDEDLVSLSMSILDKPPRSYKIDKDGVFKEDQEQVNTWEEFFRLYSDPTGLEDFMADREQDVPKDEFQVHSLRQFQFVILWLSVYMQIKKSCLERKWRAFMKDQELPQNCDSSQKLMIKLKYSLEMSVFI